MATEPIAWPEVEADAAVGTRYPGLALVVISMAQLMLVLDELIVNTALPHIQRALAFSGADLQWIVTAYAITFSGLLMLGGRSGDILGRRRMFIGGIVLFTLASLAGGTATQSWWLSRLTEQSDYLTGICLPFILFAAAAGCIFIPLTMTLVAGIADEHSGVASSMFNAGQQIGGALGLAIIGSVAWTTVYNHLTTTSHLTAGQAGVVQPGGAIYDHALVSGVTTALTIGAGAAVLALVITVATIRVRKEDLPAGPVIG